MLREQAAGKQRKLLGRREVEMSPEEQAAVKQGERRAESCGWEKKSISSRMNSLCKGSEA